MFGKLFHLFRYRVKILDFQIKTIVLKGLCDSSSAKKILPPFPSIVCSTQVHLYKMPRLESDKKNRVHIDRNSTLN